MSTFSLLLGDCQIVFQLRSIERSVFHCRDPPGSAEVDLCRQTIGRRSYSLRLQHPEGINASLGIEIERRNANLREDLDREDHHPRG